jgi:Txe/YoeB family toxin of Txe-Axe toxin-antitoxin module
VPGTILFVKTEPDRLLQDISRNGNSGIGKSEPLKGNLADFGVAELMM